MAKYVAMACCTVVLIASLSLDNGVRSLGLAPAGRRGPPPVPLRFSSAAQDRKTYPEDSPSEPIYDSAGDDGDGDEDDDDDDDPANTGDDSSREEREDQLDQDDPGNFRDSIYDSFQKSDFMQCRFVC